MKGEILSHDQWHLVEPIVKSFGDPMPLSPKQTTFHVAMDGDHLAAVLRVEQLFHFVNVFVQPEYRNGGKLALALMQEASECIPEGFSGIWLSDRKVPTIAKVLGARDLGMWRVYRKDR